VGLNGGTVGRILSRPFRAGENGLGFDTRACALLQPGLSHRGLSARRFERAEGLSCDSPG